MITATRPKVDANGYYSVTDTAKLLGVHRNTVLRYAMSGALNFCNRADTYRKLFRGSEIIRFWNWRV